MPANVKTLALARPRSLKAALATLASDPSLTPIAGCTDVYVSLQFGQRFGSGPEQRFIDLWGLKELQGISVDRDVLRIGALTTYTEMIQSKLVQKRVPMLVAASREVGGAQIQNAGTIAGNLCNASPAADGVPPLLAMDAAVALASAGGERLVPLAAFVTGNRKTARRADELVTAIRVPKPVPGAASTFLKLGARRYLVISIVMVAATIEPDERNQILRARIAVGACSPAAQRLGALESALNGLPIDARLATVVCAEHLAQALAPIDDVRGSAHYRNDAALTLVRRALGELGAKMERSPNAEHSR